MAGVNKIHDFVYFSVCLVPVELFLKKKVMNFFKNWKNEFYCFNAKGSPLEKKLKKFKFSFFQTFFLFLLESEFYMFLAFFWGLFVCLFIQAPDLVQWWVVPIYSGILTSSPRGWRVCNTPSSQEGTLSTPKGYGEGPGRFPEPGKGGILRPVLS